MSGWLRTRREDAHAHVSDPSRIRIESILDLVLEKKQTVLEAEERLFEKRLAEKRQAEKRNMRRRRRRR